MEDTHIINKDKVEKIIFILVIAFCWAYRIGELLIKEKPTLVKKHGRKAKSIFREGLDLIQQAILRIATNAQNFKLLLLCFQNSKPQRIVI